jgi:predicted HicB family RNase H-like nuclease
MEYKGYTGHVEYDEEARILHGEVLHINDVITFQADCVEDIEREFRASVDDYIEFCRLNHRSPEKPYTGKVAVRMPPDLHREVTYAAKKRGQSVNKFIIEAVESYTTKV